MDTLTHIVLGACIGEAIAGKQIGKKALVLGAIAQNIPDIDFVASFWLPTSADLLAHRGFTHSILFALLLTPLLAMRSQRLSGKGGMTLRRWIYFWGIQIFVHIFIDAFNAYGTGWFEPFSHYRVSFNTMFVADVLFMIPPAIACMMLVILKAKNAKRKLWAWIGLGCCSLYLLYGIANKMIIDHFLQHDLQNEHKQVRRFITTPTPLNNMLWYIIAENDSGYYIGYRSVFDRSKSIDFHYAYRNDALLRSANNKTDLDRLLRFSEGYYTAQMWHDTLVFNDLRFGEIRGWEQPNARFVCHYYLQHPEANEMIVQRGRFAGWDKNAIETFLKRINGN
jgi:inner membrane protein